MRSPAFVSIIAVGVAATALSLSPSGAAEQGGSAAHDALLAKLQARDKQFDNVHVTYLMRGTQELEDYSWKSPDREPLRPVQLPKEYKYVFRDDLIVRGDDVIHVRNVIEPLPGEGGVELTRFTKTSNVAGLRIELALEDVNSNSGFVSIADKQGAGFHSESSLRSSVEFALGLGFGRRMSKIETVEAVAAGFKITGRIKLEPVYDFPCSLELDHDLVVRHASINLPNKQMEVTTKGSRSQDGFAFAATGRIRNVNGDTLKDEYSVVYEKSRFNLSDARYHELKKITVPKGVAVIR